MIDYAERFELLCGTLAMVGVTDEEAISLIWASRLDCGKLVYPWLVIETDFYSLETDKAWFWALQAVPLAYLRLIRPRKATTIIEEMARDKGKPQCFIESEWRSPVIPHMKCRVWPFLMQRCVRLRITHPKRLPLEPRQLLMIKEASDMLLDCRFRETTPVSAAPPVSLPYKAELLQKISPWQRDWESLMTNLCALAVRRAYLFDREVNDTDWAAVERVMADTVPVWIVHILRQFAQNGNWHSLRGMYSLPIVRSEIKRLLSHGVCYSYRSEWKLTDKSGQGSDILELLSRSSNI